MQRAFTHALILLAIVAALLAGTWRDNPLTERAQTYAQSIATSSAATYVTLRTLNAFLSTAQEIQVEGSVVVASGAAQPLKVLEPIDDTIERIAAVVFTVMIVSGVLAVSLGPLGSVGFAMMAVALLLWAVTRIADRPAAGRALPRGLLSYGSFLALGIPLAFVVSALVADRMTAETWTTHNRIIEEITDQVDDGTVPQDQGGIRNAWKQLDRYQTLAVNVMNEADRLIGSFVSLIAVFIFKVFVLPLMLLGACFVIARQLAQRSRGASD